MHTERIIRLVAGLLVMTGVVLGAKVHPAWLLLPAFVGFNLAQSAITGFCPLEILLRRCGVPSACGRKAAGPDRG